MRAESGDGPGNRGTGVTLPSPRSRTGYRAGRARRWWPSGEFGSRSRDGGTPRVCGDEIWHCTGDLSPGVGETAPKRLGAFAYPSDHLHVPQPAPVATGRFDHRAADGRVTRRSALCGSEAGELSDRRPDYVGRTPLGALGPPSGSGSRGRRGRGAGRQQQAGQRRSARGPRRRSSRASARFRVLNSHRGPTDVLNEYVFEGKESGHGLVPAKYARRELNLKFGCRGTYPERVDTPTRPRS